jgi:hypothetical protein
MIQIFLSFLFFSAWVCAQSVQPGIWAADSTFEVNGIALPATHEQNCITPPEAKDLKKSISKDLEKNGCTPTKWAAQGNRLDISLKCLKSGLDATGNLHGHVNAKNYNLSGQAEGTYAGIPSQANIMLKGKWLKTCVK